MTLLLVIGIALFGTCRIMYDFWLVVDNGTIYPEEDDGE